MQAKSVLYAAVGAPVVAARKMTDQVNTIKGRVSKETSEYTGVATKAIDEWATEGEKFVSNISDGKVVEEISQKVDLDGAKEQVSKLRDQLEDMLDTWRQSFRPEKGAAKPAPKTAAKPAAKKPAAKKPAAKSTSAAKKPAAKTSAAKSASQKQTTAAKKSTAKSTTAKAKTS